MALPKPPSMRAGVIKRSKAKFGKNPPKSWVDATLRRNAERKAARTRTAPPGMKLQPGVRRTQPGLPPNANLTPPKPGPGIGPTKQGGGLPFPGITPKPVQQGGGLPMPKGLGTTRIAPVTAFLPAPPRKLVKKRGK